MNDHGSKARLVMHGIIFDIKEGAIYDGPGIRQTVFFKGCSLQCRWCHNPEGLSCNPELMVSTGACIHCGECLRICTRPDACVACGACISVCANRLRKIAGETLMAQELACRLLTNAAYYAKTGGGVTFSGGEPLAQPEFALETVALLDESVHKALETSGYAPEEVFITFREAFDLVMLDLKLMDPEQHRFYTGVSNECILRNAKLLCEGNTPFIIRIPVIPDVNDRDEHYRAIAELVAGAPALMRVELLPYHVTAGAKYGMLGKPYDPGFDQEKPIQINLALFDQYRIRSCVL